MSITTSNKVNWLSVLQGWSILLVVIGHVNLTNVFADPRTPVNLEIMRIIYSFHMPLFMFTSGFLFYKTKMQKDKSYGEILKDRSKRLLIPYAFFTLTTFFLKYAFNPIMMRPVSFSGKEFIDIITFSSNPQGELWFLSTLFILFLFYPVYQWFLENHWKTALLFSIVLLLNLFFPEGILFLCISYAAFYMLFFYLGICFSKYEIWRYFDRISVLLVCTVFMIVSYSFPVYPLLKIFIGIFFSLALCLFLSKQVPAIFQSFRDYAYQIFLLGIFFQMAVRYIYIGIGIESLYWPLYVSSILLALYIPVLLSKQLLKMKNPFIKRCFGL